MAYYEVQIYAKGGWKTDCIFDEKALAVDEAKRMMQDVRAPTAVRVVEEDPDRPDALPRPVFRQSRVDQHNYEATQRQIGVRREVNAARDARKIEEQQLRSAAARAAMAGKSRPPLWLTLVGRLSLLVGLVALGAGGLIGLHRWLG